MKLNTIYLIWPGLILLSLISLLLGLSFGSVSLPVHSIFSSFWQPQSMAHEIILQIRLPRVINAFVTGGLLALAGCMLQTLLDNPLADPYVLGISGGCAVMSLFAILLGIGSYYLHLVSFAGGLIAMFIVLRLSSKRRNFSLSKLLLTGVIFAAGCNAIIGLMVTLSPDSSMRSMMFWLLGDLNGNSLSIGGLLTLLLTAIFAWFLAKPLDLLSYGELKARTLGVNTKQLTLILYLLSAFITAAAVSIAGCIGFIGLITPHLIRLLGVHSHRVLLPGSILLGGSIVTLADMLSRTLIAPQQLPVGIITAFIGVPIFLILLRRKI